jgi:peptidoglycan/xylan/chitin deacetylase (PgdA/CDA1 family)
VIALTWDDGPDTDTLELARYLKRQRVSATFFVVDAWIDGVSSDPGWGTHVFETGHGSMPILGDLVRLGHRVGNHSLNHVLLGDAPGRVVIEQLLGNQAKIDPFVTDELRMFRAPGGSWSDAATGAVLADPTLRVLTGPVAWDIDRKDWDGSVSCASTQPAVECEAAGPDQRSRVRPAVMAARYASSIEAEGHGIVLLHDRVGHVGSRYALDVAEALIPVLKAHGFVFAAPVLAFSPVIPRPGVTRASPDAGTLQGDLNGDGRVDACARTAEGIECALSTDHAATRPVLWSRFDGAGAALARCATLWLADINGDGRADLCGTRVDDGSVALCGLSP